MERFSLIYCLPTQTIATMMRLRPTMTKLRLTMTWLRIMIQENSKAIKILQRRKTNQLKSRIIHMTTKGATRINTTHPLKARAHTTAI
jgi:hypothetical protein